MVIDSLTNSAIFFLVFPEKRSPLSYATFSAGVGFILFHYRKFKSSKKDMQCGRKQPTANDFRFLWNEYPETWELQKYKEHVCLYVKKNN